MSNPIYSQWKNSKLLSWLLTGIGVILLAELGMNQDPIVRAVGCGLALLCSRVALHQDRLASRSGNIWRNYEEWADEQALRALTQKRPEVKEDILDQPEAWQPPMYDWVGAASEAVGFLIIGNSGYGKTSIAAFLAGLLTQSKPAQVIVLDPHWNDVWEELGLTVVGDFPQIEAVLKFLIAELKLRRERKKNKQPLGDDILIISDEIGACLEEDNFDSNAVTKALRRIGAEGRKFGLILIGINQSSTEEDMGISPQMRNNYVLVLVGAATRNRARLLGKDWMSYFKGQPYPCMLSGAIEDLAAMHPTHGTYSDFKKKGNRPLNLLPINQLEPKILSEIGVLSGSKQSSPDWVGSSDVQPGSDDRTYLERLWNLEFEGLGSTLEPSTKPYESMGDSGEDLGSDPGSFPEIDGLDDETLKLFIIAFRGDGITTQDEFITAMWSIKKGASPRYQRARERYQFICKKYNL